MIEGELRLQAAEHGFEVGDGANVLLALADGIVDDVHLPWVLTTAEVVSFANVVATPRGEVLNDVPVTGTTSAGEELQMTLGSVVASVREAQLEVFDLLVALLRIRNARLAEAASIYAAFAGQRGLSREQLQSADNVIRHP
jgi:hypothetical protein